MADEHSGRHERRSQKDRSESMQRRVLDATLKCIAERGYIGVSLQDIADLAGVSRGAITHHYPSKIELTSAAIQHFVEWRYDRVHAAFEGTEHLGLAQRLDVMWSELQQIFPITFELIVAMRADKELLALYRRGAKGRVKEITTGFDEFFPELSGMKGPGVMIAVIAAFFRGVYIDSVARDPAFVEEMKTAFQDMLAAYMAKEQKAA